MMLLESRFPRANQWGFMPACGTRMTGQLKVGVWRLIGPKHLSPLPTGNSMPMPTELVPIQSPQPQKMITRHGVHKELMQQAETGFDGCRPSTWSTTTAMTANGFPMVFRRNASAPDSSNHPWDLDLHISLFYFDENSLFFYSFYSLQVHIGNKYKSNRSSLETHFIMGNMHSL